MPAPCRHTEPILQPPGEPYNPAYCRRCWLYAYDPVYRAQCDGLPTPPSIETDSAKRHPPGLPCIYLQAVMDTVNCLCPGKWIRGCAKHGTTTLEQCKTCPDYFTE